VGAERAGSSAFVYAMIVIDDDVSIDELRRRKLAPSAKV
jgi:hypothetical protein